MPVFTATDEEFESYIEQMLVGEKTNYLHDYETVPQAIAGLGRYFKFYNRERLHQSLDYKTPEIVYRLTA